VSDGNLCAGRDTGGAQKLIDSAQDHSALALAHRPQDPRPPPVQAKRPPRPGVGPITPARARGDLGAPSPPGGHIVVTGHA
jgi:hypothetical protein